MVQPHAAPSAATASTTSHSSSGRSPVCAPTVGTIGPRCSSSTWSAPRLSSRSLASATPRRSGWVFVAMTAESTAGLLSGFVDLLPVLIVQSIADVAN